MENVENRNRFVLRFLREVVHILADINYQRRVWASGEGPEDDSFDETINQFYYFYSALRNDYENYGLSKEEFEDVHSLREKIREYCEVGPVGGMDYEIIEHPAWNTVVKSAQSLSRILARYVED